MPDYEEILEQSEQNIVALKQQIEAFSKKSKLPIEYLTILNREARSYHPSPIPLSKFAGIKSEDIQKLADVGINNTKNLFNKSRTKGEIKQLVELTGIPIKRINEFVSLSDLSRLYGVGPFFARMIYDVGVTSVQIFIKHTPEEFIEIYEKETKKKADFGVNDIKFSIELARELET